MSLDGLIHRFLDDQSELSPDEFDALIAGLRAEPERAAALRGQLIIDDLLAQKLTLDRRNFLAQVEQRIADFEHSESEIDEQVAELHELAAAPVERPSQWSGRSVWVQGVCAAALVAVVLGLLLVPQYLPRSPQAVAKVLRAEGEVTATQGEQSDTLQAAATLFAGQQIVTPAEGSLSLEYADNTRVQLAGGSLVTLDADPASGAKRVRIERGELWANVAPQQSGPMLFSTPHATATVLGTQLRLVVTENETLLQVTEGKVRLDHAGGEQPVLVEAKMQAVAASDRLQMVALAWPERLDGVTYLVDPTEYGMVALNPESGNLRATPLEPRGAAAFDELTLGLKLAGGHFVSADAGNDICEASRQASEFSLEIVFQPAAEELPGPVVTLADESDGTNFLLSQADGEMSLTLRTDSALPAEPFRFRLAPSTQFIHLTITCAGGEWIAYQAGNELARQRAAGGSLTAWQPGALLVGSDGRGQTAWRGTIAALAIYCRCLPPAEVARNIDNYRILSGATP